MTTFTGIWGNTVVRNNKFLTLTADEMNDAINIDHGYSPLYEYFPDPIDDDHLVVAPSAWGMPRRRALARLCQQETLVYPAWQIVTEWITIDAAECLPRFLLVIECTQLNATFTLVRTHDARRFSTTVYPGMGFAPVVQENEPDQQGQAIEWAQAIASTARLMVHDLRRDCDVLVLTGPPSLETDACELVCETLRAAGVVSYRISPTDMWVVVKERKWRADTEHQRDVLLARRAALRKKRFRKPTRTDYAVIIMTVVAMLSMVLAGAFGTEKRPEDAYGRQGIRSVDPAQVITFPGGMLSLPGAWTVTRDSPPTVDLTTHEQWRTIIAPVNEPNLRMLLTLKQDPDHHLRDSLQRQLSDPMATIKPWVSSYQWPTNGWVPPVALSYRELTGEVSRADWVVFYTDRYAYSLACQYRVREGMTEQKAHKLCQAILNGIRVS